ncbi:MBOAT-domain-containing protein [Dichomitus squalens]|uniref:MBOAT-domain-containing protein n=1 Tax=Dichomitus squalens TaxID=114155 RepID=A0A4Q9MJQ5_9APHY|nr:MBOAT-domain-containing protein [Dichomitus squalens]
MLGDAVVQMPTDLRPTSTFELDSPLEPSHRPKGITRLTVDVPSSYSSQVKAQTHPAPRWRTPEFMVYYVTFLCVVPLMVWIPYTLSSPSHPNYPYYERSLSPGWLFGRRVDNSDNQYRSFRNGLLPLTLLASVYFGLKLLYAVLTRKASSLSGSNNLYRIPFLVVFCTAMLFSLHGASALKVFAILSANYGIAKTCKGSKAGPILTWMFNALVLYANERNSGHRFEQLHPIFASLDAWQGIYPRWYIGFNITMLRLVSFSMDYYWACRGVGLPETSLSDKHRPRVNHSLDTYSFLNYIAYALYPPLYIAGPIMTFNDFMWQLKAPLTITWRTVLGYLGRFVVCIMTLEMILHLMYVVAIKDRRAWVGYSAAELCMVGFWNLIIVWLKLLVPWRFFRLWALADGIDPPENMVRCMANNYSPLGFWRAWHRSYNLWIVRYIYVPLGGARNRVAASVLIFTFVALWHDLSFKLLAWGWLVSLFILPEVGARYLLPASKFGDRAWYRHVGAVGGVLNVLMMMTANLVGFVIGTDGMKYMMEQIVGSWQGIRFLLFACACLFVGIQIMFEYREEEERQGIVRRC